MEFDLYIIPTILFFLTIKVKLPYKILLSILFFILGNIIGIILSIVISDIHYTLTDKIGYNYITDFTRNLSRLTNFIFLSILTIILFYKYKTSKK